MTTDRDWEGWELRLRQCLEFTDASVSFPELFAPGGNFQDPATEPTTDIESIVAAG